MAMRRLEMMIPSRYREQVVGALSAGVGLGASELAAEFTARTTGLTGYMKAGAKTLVKIITGTLFWGLGLKAAAFASWGSTLLDWLFAIYPGGISGFAERLAVTVRTWTMGVERVAAEMTALERVETPKSVVATAPTAGFRVVRD